MDNISAANNFLPRAAANENLVGKLVRNSSAGLLEAALQCHRTRALNSLAFHLSACALCRRSQNCCDGKDKSIGNGMPQLHSCFFVFELLQLTTTKGSQAPQHTFPSQQEHTLVEHGTPSIYSRFFLETPCKPRTSRPLTV